MRALAAWLFLCVPLTGSSEGSEDLSEAIALDEVQLALIRGTGIASGLALEGVLANPTGKERVYHVLLREPLFLENQGSGQNMLVTRIYSEDGHHYREGKLRWIHVPEGVHVMPVSLGAYGLDFERDAPTEAEVLVIAEMPPGLRTLAQEVRRLERETHGEFDKELIQKGVQVAIWYALGVPLDRIEQRFDFERDHLSVARVLLEELVP